MTYPTVHLNGTSRNSLVDQYQNAANAVRTAIDTVAQNGPHGRDYYVVDGAFEAARKEHQARLDKLRSVLHEIDDILDHIA